MRSWLFWGGNSYLLASKPTGTELSEESHCHTAALVLILHWSCFNSADWDQYVGFWSGEAHWERESTCELLGLQPVTSSGNNDLIGQSGSRALWLVHTNCRNCKRPLMKCCLEYYNSNILSDRTSVLLREGIDIFKDFLEKLPWLSVVISNI